MLAKRFLSTINATVVCLVGSGALAVAQPIPGSDYRPDPPVAYRGDFADLLIRNSEKQVDAIMCRSVNDQRKERDMPVSTHNCPTIATAQIKPSGDCRGKITSFDIFWNADPARPTSRAGAYILPQAIMRYIKPIYRGLIATEQCPPPA